MSSGYPQPLVRLIDALKALPGVGDKTAERFAFHILKQSAGQAAALGEAIGEARASVRHCKQCFNLTQGDLCAVCADASRDGAMLCVVESPKELLSIETSGVFKGRYHCLLGHLAPAEGVGEDDLTIPALVKRCQVGGIKEVILATNPNLHGDATALAVMRALDGVRGIAVTRLARGVPAGWQLEYLSGHVMQEAFGGRTKAAQGGGP